MRIKSAIFTLFFSSSYAQCLIDSPITIGEEAGTPFSNRAEIEALGVDNQIMHSFETCKDENDHFSGVQFTLILRDDVDKITPLEPIGEMEL